MDKYEYKVRADEIKALIAEGDYVQAAEIADTIDWRRVKSVMMLCTVSDLYKINRRYEDAKNMLLLAHDRRPGGRTICYSLCELCIKTEEFVQAINYYKEFVQAAPKDPGRYILQYKLYEAQEVGLEERIGVLEELKKRDYREKWAYELAYLYHRMGLATRCVEECDEMILWFGDGKYVIKAMELKMLHEPLTESQQDVYDRRFEPEVSEELYEGEYGGQQEDELQSDNEQWGEWAQGEEQYAPSGEEDSSQGDPEEMDIQVKTMDVGKYNTINLQEELAAGLQEVLGAEDGSEAFSGFEQEYGEEQAGPEPWQAEEYQESSEEMEGTEVFFGETGEMTNMFPEEQEALAYAGEMNRRETAGEETGAQESADVQDSFPQEADSAVQNDSGGEESLQQEYSREREEEEEGIYASREKADSPESESETDLSAAEVVRETDVPAPDETARQVMQEMRTGAASAAGTQPPRELAEVLSQEADGQISLVLPENAAVERQITGQMNIEDILAEWERMKKENEEKYREEVRRHVQRHTGPMFTEFEAAVRDGLLEQLEQSSRSKREEERTAVREKAVPGEPEGGAVGFPGAEEKTEPEFVREEAAEQREGEETGEPVELYGGEAENGKAGYISEEGGEPYGAEAGYAVEEFVELYEAEEEPVEAGYPDEEYAEQYEAEGEPAEAEYAEPYAEQYDAEGEPVEAEYEYSGEEYAEQYDTEGEPIEAGYADEEYAEQYDAEGELIEAEYTGEEYAEQYDTEGEPIGAEYEYLGEEYTEQYEAEGEPAEAQYADGESAEVGYITQGTGEDGDITWTYMDDGDSEPYAETASVGNAEDVPEELFYGEEESGAYQEPIPEAEDVSEGKEKKKTGKLKAAAKKRNKKAEIKDNEAAGEPESADGTDSLAADEGLARDDRQALAEKDEIDDISDIIEAIEEAAEAEKRQGGATTAKMPRKAGSQMQTDSPTERETAKVRALTREEKELFAPFLQSRQTREQLVKAIDGISMAAYTGNVVITGEEGMDTLTLAKNIVREVSMTDRNFSGKAAKITGRGLNQKKVKETLEQLNNGALIIQKASGMSMETATALHRALQQEKFGIIVILEDTKKAIKKLFLGTPELYGDFTSRLDLEALSNDILVSFGKRYAREKEYAIDELGVLALHTRIEECQTIDHVVTVIEVKQIVDQAISHANRKTFGHFLDILFARRYDDEDMIILTEKDFVA